MQANGFLIFVLPTVAQHKTCLKISSQVHVQFFCKEKVFVKQVGVAFG